MNKREFNALLNKVTTRKRVDVKKVLALTDEEKSAAVYHIVKYRGPIVVEFIPEGFDLSWLACMGYLYKTKGKQYTFVHTCEHVIK